MNTQSSNQPVWTPSVDRIQSTALYAFEQLIAAKYNQNFDGYQSFHRWSVENPQDFWAELWDFCDVQAKQVGQRLIEKAPEMRNWRFFPEAALNYAENLLRRRDDAPALIFQGEDQVKRTLSFGELYDEVSRVQQALRDMGVEEGDRVAGYLPNMPETIIAMLATASIGAIWSSASPDFGVQGVLDRFGQIKPKVLFAVDAYYYNGKTHDCLGKLEKIIEGLPSLEHTIVMNYAGSGEVPDEVKRYEDMKSSYQPQDIEFTQLPFNHPLFIMFSSGTTGVPKCIVHGAGGVLLQHLKEHRLHCDTRKDDKVFYFTTCGWMMWNWLVSALACEATLLLYDGAPFYPDGNVLWDFADAHGCTLFGTSAKYLDALKKEGFAPVNTHKLESLRVITSTGSPLVHEGFDFVYEKIKQDVHLASIYGGTDLISCFLLGNPVSPVYRGQIQGPGLTMDVDVLDDAGQSIQDIPGEFVCKTPFPSMPVEFWNDPDGEKYRAAYFETFGENIWRHGDWVVHTDQGGFIVHGRSDATLNPGGVRIGTAEIYRQVEKLPEIKESIVVGQDWKDDVRVVLFVVLTKGNVLDEALETKIKQVIREGATPRHVPAKIIPIQDIPRTKSGKITELAVRHVIHGRPVKNTEALANPEALRHYEGLKELES